MAYGGTHFERPEHRQLKALDGCRTGMGIETCFECKLDDCDEDKGRHYRRDEEIRQDYARGMPMREVAEKWGICKWTIQIIVKPPSGAKK